MVVAGQRLGLVSGGSRGLGQALCEHLQAEGFRVIEFSRLAPARHSVSVDLAHPATAGQRISAALADIDPATLSELLVISNAATLQPIGPTALQPESAVVQSLNVNFVSAILLMRAVMAHFQDCPARKVLAHVSSGAALRSHAGLSLYGAAKAGMEHYMRTLAVEQQGQTWPFLAVTVDPGALDTDMQAQLRAASPAQMPGVTAFIERNRQGRLAPASQVAAAIVRSLRSTALVSGSRCELGAGRLARPETSEPVSPHAGA